MTGQRQQVDRQPFEIDRDLADSLCGVHVKQHVVLPADRAERRDILYDACLVVDVHDRCQLRIGTQCSGEGCRVEMPVRIRLEPGHLEALFFQHAKDVRDRLVFGRHGHQVLAAMRPIPCSTGDREIVRLGRTGGPDQCPRIDVQQCGKLPGSDLDAGLACSARDVIRRRICECVFATVSMQSATRPSTGVVAA